MDGRGDIHQRCRAFFPAEQRGEAGGVEGGGHGHENEIVMQLPQLGEHAEDQVGFEMPLMDLIDDHGGDPVQIRVIEQAPQQYTRRHHLDGGMCGDLPVAADGVTDLVAEPGSPQLGDA